MANIFKKLFNKNKHNKKQEMENIEDIKEDKIEQSIDTNSQEIEDNLEYSNEEDKISEENDQELTVTVEEEIEEITREKVDEIALQNVVEKPKGLFAKLKQGLSKTSNNIRDKVNGVLANFRKIDEDLFEELEEMLVISDIGVQTVTQIIENIKEKVKLKNIQDPQQIKVLLKEEIGELFDDNDSKLHLDSTPSIILVVGVNGAGKTTSIGKIAHKYKQQGKSIMLAAGDTFRAAAIDQLEVWGNRVGIDVVKHNEGADPGAVIYDAIKSAIAKNVDILICDTAGRLHNKKNLMNELGKVQRIIDRELPNASKEILLVVDATTGQNAVQQAKTFSETTNLSGIVLTKLDGTAKGGIILTIKSELNIPVKYIGVGEGIEDLQEFDSANFVNALFED